MSLQYIKDAQGNNTGVFIPIDEWQLLTEKYIGLQQIELEGIDIPDWHKQILDERLKDYYQNPENNADFNSTLNEIKAKYVL
ncbi:addiction module protein [Chryseobacterium caseinilyticum]|uniref:Addiction module protein n=1 Tax=Chryseobacterium caseinilyticum TaxID=2771428 RepID=A0ABR8ZEK9_9FLAO|nr:addiction module protein [Chryseobacterium caseinilyticum]MBD8083716.1 addiction module protein [Chryseobacterium caseinilyticum]